MSIIIRSEAVRIDWPDGEDKPARRTTILDRKRTLHRGDVIHLEGEVATDIETRGSFLSAKVRLKIGKNKTMTISFKRTMSSVLEELLFRKAGIWEGEKEINPLKLTYQEDFREARDVLDHAFNDRSDYNIVNCSPDNIPDAFTPGDLLFLLLEKRKPGEIEVITRIFYEPTLPPQSRK